MLLIECSNIKKYFGVRLVLDIDNLKIDSKEDDIQELHNRYHELLSKMKRLKIAFNRELF